MLPKTKESKGGTTDPFRPARLATDNSTNGEFFPDIIKYGNLRKLKTMKKKFFILRMDSDTGPARLEYYDSEKKWKSGIVCKRSIILKTCFNINKKMDSKQKFAIALYTKDDCFAIVLENEIELEEWLTTLLALQQGHSGLDGDTKPKPNFEHVWQVNVKNKGLGSSRNITGAHRLCLTSKTLSLVKMFASIEEPEIVDFPLMSIRRCGHSDCFFFMELGRSSVTGAGELWMQTEDTIIAQNMHEAILGAMKSSREHEDLGPLSRPRSASTSENSKPLATRRPVGVVPPQPMTTGILPRDRCDSMPSRSRTVSEGHHDVGGSPQNLGRYSSPSRMSHHYEIPRPHTTYCQPISYSPPMVSNSLGTSAYSDSAGSNLSMDDFESTCNNDFHHRFHSHSSDVSVHTEPTITEEALDDYLTMTPGSEGNLDQLDYIQMAPMSTQQRSSSMFLNLTSASEENFSSPNSPTNADYMDMATPSTPSLADTAEGYIPMSPVGSMSVDLSVSSMPSSKKSSIVAELVSPSGLLQEEGADGYVPMAPILRSTAEEYSFMTAPAQPTSEGYMEMNSLSSSLPKSISPASGYMELTSPTHSSHSLQDLAYSCSPVAPKLEEFHLDKVKSYFPPSEENDDYIKPVRAYSIGSRPQLRKNHLTSHLETFRVRAYSFGSQVNNNANNSQAGIEAELGTMKKIDGRASRKSSSAPLLPSGLPSRTRSSASRSDHNDDLMEIVYTPSTSSRSSKVSQDSGGERLRTFSYGSSRQHASRTSSFPHDAGGKQAQTESKNTKVPTSSAKSQSSVVPAKATAEETPERNYMLMGNERGPSTERENTERRVKSEDSQKADASKTRSITVAKPVTLAKDLRKSPNTFGDYVNLELGNPTWPSNLVSATMEQKHDAINSTKISATTNAASSSHNYINLQLGSVPKSTAPISKKSVSLDSNYSDYTMMSPPAKSNEESSSLFGSKASIKTSEKPSPPYLDVVLSQEPEKRIASRNNSTNSLDSTSLAIGSLPIVDTSPKPILCDDIPILPPSPDHSGSSFSTYEEISSDFASRKLAVSPFASGKRKSLPVVEGAYENISIGLGSASSSRPSSVSSERELNYASLDLAPVSGDETPRSPRTLKAQNPSPPEQAEVPLSYAEIDFTKSEGLRHTSGTLREGRV